MDMKGVNKAISTARSVAKKSTRLFADVLPIVSIGANVLDSYQDSGGNLLQTSQRLVLRYSGFNPADGSWNPDKLGQGLGTLIGSVLAGWTIKQFV